MGKLRCLIAHHLRDHLLFGRGHHRDPLSRSDPVSFLRQACGDHTGKRRAHHRVRQAPFGLRPLRRPRSRLLLGDPQLLFGSRHVVAVAHPLGKQPLCLGK